MGLPGSDIANKWVAQVRLADADFGDVILSKRLIINP